MPIFYFNVGENCCANESWVAEYLVNEGICSCFDEAVDELRNHRCFNGWFECTVCNTITDCMYECGVDAQAHSHVQTYHV